MRVILGTCISVLTCLVSLPFCVVCLLIATTNMVFALENLAIMLIYSGSCYLFQNILITLFDMYDCSWSFP